MNFIQALENELNRSVTENGALGLRTTGKALLDMNFKVTSYRNSSEEEIINDFTKSLSEDFVNTMLWLFFCRDIREGLGERRTFRVIMEYLSKNYTEIVIGLLPLIPEYGRWDDLTYLIGSNPYVDNKIISIIGKQLFSDIENMGNKKPISLLGKWLPSENASSVKTKRLATFIRLQLSFTSKEYRKVLSNLRKYLNVVEKNMSANKWKDIEYESVPSKANLIYSNAFLKHDEERRVAYLNGVKDGTKKINSSTNYPYEIIHKYRGTGLNVDNTMEELWKALPKLPLADNTLVVADGSGSMMSRVSTSTNATALDVANSLAIYCAENAKGPYHNKYITFSYKPRYVDFNNCKTLKDKIMYAQVHNEVSNTNIEAVFDLILHTAVDNNLTKDELPKNVLIISDMEFDAARTNCLYYNEHANEEQDRLFKLIRTKYSKKGYELPKLIFWNVCSRTNTIPVKENKQGVALVSGFSQNILKMVMSDNLDAYGILTETLNSDRYKPVKGIVENYR